MHFRSTQKCGSHGQVKAGNVLFLWAEAAEVTRPNVPDLGRICDDITLFQAS